VRLSEEAQAHVAAMLARAYEFFRLNLNDKLPNVLPEECGYRPFGVEYSSAPNRPDQVESFTVTRRFGDSHSKLSSKRARLLSECMLTVFDELECIAEAVTVELAQILSGKIVGDNLISAFHRWSRLQLNYSRPASIGSDLINDPHEDGTLITLVGATGPGLEIQRRSGIYRQADSAYEKDVTILPGEIASLLSGSLIAPRYHRVRRDYNLQERISFIFFGDIEPSLCQPWISNDTNLGIDIGQRILTNVKRFGLKGFA
jgi:isopenicillin N synthase-like dioxygenase